MLQSTTLCNYASDIQLHGPVQMCGRPPRHPPSTKGGYPYHVMCNASTARVWPTEVGNDTFAWLMVCLACCRGFHATYNTMLFRHLLCLHVLAIRPHHFLKRPRRCAFPPPKSPIVAINGRKRRARCLSFSNSAIIHGFSGNSFARTFLHCFKRTYHVSSARMSKVFISANPISSLNSRIRKSCVFHSSWNATQLVYSRLCWSTMLYFDLHKCVVSFARFLLTLDERYPCGASPYISWFLLAAW